MLISDMAVRDLQSQRDATIFSVRALLSRLIAPFGLGQRGPAPIPAPTPLSIRAAEPPPPVPSPESQRATGPVATETLRWRRHPQLRDRDDALSPGERQARLAAVRGLFNARSGDYEAARCAFAQAVREANLDLTALPGFWSLPRGGLTAAVLGYEDAGRLRDASALAAYLRTNLRPRPVTLLPSDAELRDKEPRRLTATGG